MFNLDREKNRISLFFIESPDFFHGSPDFPLSGVGRSVFREIIWNSHRVRAQKEAQTPKGIPNHLYSFPETYGTYGVILMWLQTVLYERQFPFFF